jgi:beta-lactamase class A
MKSRKQTSRIFLEKSLNNIIETAIKQGFDGEPKISVYDINTGVSYNIKGDSPGWAASIIKFPIMVAAMKEINQGNLGLEEKLAINHKFTLEQADLMSRLPNGELISLPELICEMIVHSDNEATNMIANRIGVETINNFMWDIDMNKSMLGHLLCPKMPRYTSRFNRDGSNITTPNDMVQAIRQVYDEKFSKLDENTRKLSDYFFTFTERENIKSKIGFISDFKDGEDFHEVGIIGNRIIYAIMINKIKQKEIKKYGLLQKSQKFEERSQVNQEDDFYNQDLKDILLGFSYQRENIAIPEIPDECLQHKSDDSDQTNFRTAIPEYTDIVFPTLQSPSIINRPYTKKELFQTDVNKDLMNSIISQKRHKNQNLKYIPTADEMHYMIKNVLKTYLYI